MRPAIFSAGICAGRFGCYPLQFSGRGNDRIASGGAQAIVSAIGDDQILPTDGHIRHWVSRYHRLADRRARARRRSGGLIRSSLLEHRVRTTIVSRTDWHGRCAAIDKFSHLGFVTTILLSDGSRKLTRDLVSRAPPCGIECQCCPGGAAASVLRHRSAPFSAPSFPKLTLASSASNT